MTEREWVDSLCPKLLSAMAPRSDKDRTIVVETGRRLIYALELADYNGNGQPNNPDYKGYQTDLLIADKGPDGAWTPRVVIECKKSRVTTHDALTYSTKAATHKQVHPYLRYGILVGDLHGPVPSRLVRHGTHFDFMVVFASMKPTPTEWRNFRDMLLLEIDASRQMQHLLADRSRKKRTYRVVHRPLVLKP
jgi:hypothetical protein